MALIQNSPVLLLFVVAAIYIQLDQGESRPALQKSSGFEFVFHFSQNFPCCLFAPDSLPAVTTLSLSSAAQNTIPGRCWCPKSVKFTKGNMTDFQVLERHPGCDKTELM